MARPREFDEAAVLDAAMDCFWQNGYEATSVRDLAAHMGITGASLYNAFGDKHELFRQVVRRYAERSTRERISRLESSLPPKEAVRAFLGEIVERSTGGDRRGCLLVNTALEAAPDDPELRQEVAAQRDGSIPPGRTPEDLARLMLGVTLGLRVLARSTPERELLEGVARPALALLDWPEQTEQP